MKQLLIIGESILAEGPFTVTENEITAADAIYPKHVIEGWQIVDAEVPDGFTCAGCTWDGQGVVVKPLVVVPPVVPAFVTRRQAKQALLLQGLLANVQPAIDAITDATQRGLMQIEWDDSQEFVRSRPSLISIGAALGLDAAGLDALFVQAEAL